MTESDKKVTKKRYIIWSNFKEFTENTSIHGLKFITANNASIIERLWWLIMIIFSIVICSYLIKNAWNEWNEKPIIISFDDKPTLLFEIPFPAITVCPLTKININKYDITKLKENFENMTEKEKREVNLINFFCRPGSGNYVRHINDSDIEYMKMVAMPNYLIFGAIHNFAGVISDYNLYLPIMTDDGLCYTYNMQQAEKLLNINTLAPSYDYLQNVYYNGDDMWNIDDGYLTDKEYKVYPMRGTNRKEIHLLNVEKENPECTKLNGGYKFYFHSPADIPTSSHPNIILPHNVTQGTITVTPKVKIASQNLLNYNPEKRKCYYSWERPLKYFKTYTESNCRFECLANYTYHVCGCVMLHMPRSSDVPICGARNSECRQNAENKFRGIEDVVKATKKPGDNYLKHCNDEHYSGFYDDDLTNITGITVFEFLSPDIRHKVSKESVDDVLLCCNCLPACRSYTYHAEMAEDSCGYVNILLTDSEIIAIKRSELYGETDFVANVGGLIGLCLGFSVFSLVEVIFYFIRMFWGIFRNKFLKNNAIKEDVAVEENQI